MQQKSTFITIGIVVLLIAGLVVWGVADSRQKNQQNTANATPDAPVVYYYGAECSHCLRVQEFLDANNIADKVQYTKKEVWHDTKNSAELSERAKSVCGLDPDKIGVPFVIADGKCFVGETEVMTLFKQKAGLAE
jgi:glutaredoxin